MTINAFPLKPVLSERNHHVYPVACHHAFARSRHTHLSHVPRARVKGNIALKRIFRFFTSLRGRLILTYTLVTVLALLALEIICLAAILSFVSFTNADRGAYLSDVIYTLYPRAARYLQPDAQDVQGLQAWLDNVYQSRHASSEPISWLDSPAAILIDNKPLYVLSPARRVIAQTAQGANLIGQTYTPPNPATDQVLQNALDGILVPQRLTTITPDGNYWMAIPILQNDNDAPVLGALVLTIFPPPPPLLQILPFLAGTVALTGVLLLLAVIPFGALFGFIMSRGLTRRLANLSAAADAYSRGDFSVAPQDASGDEISALGTRLRHMAQELQTLLRTQQELAMLQERNRIARELHDTIKQQNFAALMQIRAARNRLGADASSAAQALTQAEQLVKTSQQELGILITELHPAALRDQDLARALQNYLETWSHQTGIAAVFDSRNKKRVASDIELALYRVAQEALANVARHSQATAVTVTLDHSPTALILTIADNGVGLDVAQTRGFGLTGMQERLTALGGALNLTSTKENGTTLVACVPLQE